MNSYYTTDMNHESIMQIRQSERGNNAWFHLDRTADLFKLTEAESKMNCGFLVLEEKGYQDLIKHIQSFS